MSVVQFVVESKKRTLIVVRRVLTEPKASLAGVILEVSTAWCIASMAEFNAEIAPSRPLGRWDSTFMVETRGICERTVRLEGCEEGLFAAVIKKIVRHGSVYHHGSASGIDNRIRARG